MEWTRVIRWGGNIVLWGFTLTKQDIYFIITLIITILNMILEYLKQREETESC